MPALMATVVCVALVTSSTALTQSDGDLLAHIALGRRILQTGIPASVTPAWGAAMLLALLDRAGGLSLIAAVVAILAAFTHAMLLDVVLQRSVPLRIALPTAMLGVVFAASHWLARPHAFTIAASATLIVLLERGDRGDRGQGTDRRASLAIPPLFALWANLHGGVELRADPCGLLRDGAAHTAVAPVADRERSRHRPHAIRRPAAFGGVADVARRHDRARHQ